MGFSLSKAWSGVKKVVKKVAHAAKKVSKKITTSLPGGEKLWKAGTRIGGQIMGGIAKVVDAIGPVGMIALSFIIPAMGPLLATMWGSFGATAAAMATSASGMVSALGQVGTAIFNGANFVGGTLGAMGDAISQGASALMKGGEGVLGKASEAFTKNMASAFKGEAGMGALRGSATQAAFDAGGQALANDATAQMLLGKTSEFAGKAIVDRTGALITSEGQKFAAESALDKAISKSLENVAGKSFESVAKEGLGSSLQAALEGGFEQGAGAFADLGATTAPLSGSAVLDKSIDAALSQPIDLGAASGADVFTPKSSSFLDKAGKAASALGSLLDTGGGGAADPEGFTAGRKFHTVSAAGQAKSIRGFQGTNLFEQILQQARGGFA